MPISNFFNQVTRKAGEIWGQADRALGGWLPGGGTASPLTRSAQQFGKFVNTVPQANLRAPAQPFTRIPGATPNSPVWDIKTRTLTPEAKEVLRQLNQSPDVTWDINKTNPVAKIGSEIGAYHKDMTAHANPLKNQIYLPLTNLNSLRTLIHEAGHLDRTRRSSSRPFTEGILGQAIDTPASFLREATGGEMSPFKGHLAPFRMAGGFLTALSDAREEDYAEKFTMDATKGMLGEETSSQGGFRNEPSTYAHRLYNKGQDSFAQGISDITPLPVKLLLGQ